MKFKFKTEPFKHQLETFEATRDLENYAIFWEQGTGKTKLVLDTAAWLYANNHIDALFVVAPNGVHRNWVVEELQKHFSATLFNATRSVVYSSKDAKKKSFIAQRDAVLEWPKFAIAAMNYDAIITDKGKDFAKKILTTKRCLYVLDESTRIKNPAAKRTKTILSSSRYAHYRRVLTGTPVANGPLDVYAQMKFLWADYWKAHGLNSYTTFKNYFAQWGTATNGATGRQFKVLNAYQNLEELNEIIQRDSSRVLKTDVLDLPPKLYSKRYFQLSKKQAKMYEQVRDNMLGEFDDGRLVTADLALKRILRLQQITCGYVTAEQYLEGPDGQMVVHTEIVDLDDTRIKCLTDSLEDVSGKVIIWSRFTRDIENICKALGDKAVRYDGKVSTEKRAQAIEDFQRGGARYFVANPAAAATGLTLTAANTVVYYANDFRLENRLQSEDRAHRIGQEHPVEYIDIVAEGTVDEKIIDALRNKKDLAREVTGDKFSEWV